MRTHTIVCTRCVVQKAYTNNRCLVGRCVHIGALVTAVMKSSGLMYMAGACDSDALGPVAIMLVGCCSTGEPANDIGGDGVPA